MYRMSRSILTVSATGLMCLFTGLASAASATPASGVKGDPQPEMKPFRISSVHSQAPGSAAIEPNGDIVVIYDIYSGKTGKTTVCVLQRGARKCATTVNLSPPSGDDVFTVPEVFAPTVQTTGKQALLLRLFNGSKFGAAHVVPGTKGGGPEAFSVDQDPRGTVHVFSSRAAAKNYELLEVSTSAGTHWSHPTNLGSGTPSNFFAGALDAKGTGLVLGTAPPWGHPVLAPQGVSFSLKPSTITKGHTTTGTGKGSPAAKGRTVELQVKKSGLWDTVATTAEGSAGTFSFTIKGASTGTFDYRAVVADLPGYLQFGYSPAQPLKVTS